ncbi:MAG TPA: hypothetical protein VHJ17_20910 [Thermomonospora sp.]|nr:hypothetical protein [Thermomonospora sp.]
MPPTDGSPFAPPPPGAFAARPGESFDSADADADRPQAPGSFGLADPFPAPGAPGEQPAPGTFAQAPGEPFGPPPAQEPGPFGPPPGEQFAPGDFGAPQGEHFAPGSFGTPPAEGFGGGSAEGGFGQVPADAYPPPGPVSYEQPQDVPAASGGGGRRNKPLLIGGAVVAGVALVGAGYTVSSMLTGDGEKEKPKAAVSPTRKAAPVPTQAPVRLNVKLRSRTTDPNPLTLKEVFGNGSFTSKGTKYVRTAWKHDKSCTRTVRGEKLESALKKGGCAQVLRATFARSDGKLIGTVGVLNLRSESAARAADKAGAGRDAHLEPLAGTGVTKKIGKGVALGTTFVRGHYLIMTWVQRPDGKSIASKYHKAVSTFQQQVILGSNLSRALHYRGIEGKPLTS